MTVHHPNFPPSLSIIPNVEKRLGDSRNGDAFGVEAQREAISKYGIAGRTLTDLSLARTPYGEAAYALCAYVDPLDRDARDFDPPFVEDTHEPLGVIELGSGTGVVAARIAAAIQRASKQGGFVISTDLPDVCPLLRYNLNLDTEPPSDGGCPEPDVVFVRPLAWGNLDHASSVLNELASRRLTHIVCSDLASSLFARLETHVARLTSRVQVYFPGLFGPLLRTLVYLTSSPRTLPVKIVISYKVRSHSKEAPFWSAFGLWFSFRPVLERCMVRPINSADERLDGHWKKFGADEDADQTFVFVAHRWPESILWHVPETDGELIEGLGARGTTTRKGDDTFETILFMNMDDTGE